MFRALKNPSYRVYWIGLLISQMGNWVQMVARPWLVYEITSSTAALGFIAFLNAIPLLFLSLFGGVLADRSDRRQLLVVTQTLYMLLAFVLAFLVWAGVVEVWHVACLSLLGGIITAYDLPARQAMVTDMVGKADLMNAIALNSTAFNTARILGPTIAGFLVVWVGMAFCFFLNGLSFLAIIFPLMRLRFQQTPPQKEGNVWENMREGLSYIRHQPQLLAFISIVTASGLFALPYGTLMPAFAQEVFGTNAAGMGALFAASGFGALAGALLLARLSTSETKPGVVILAAFGLSLALLAFSAARTLPMAVAALALVGLCATSQNATTHTLVQTMVPDRLRGRVMSAFMMVFQGFMPFGNLLAGFVAERWGAPFAVRMGGMVFLAYVALMTLRIRWRGEMAPLSNGQEEAEAPEPAEARK
ncbi:MAG: MFS transporter [Armatimonadetes bacterium]|nr:MFS transporter [Armatimonadota bacterium]